MATRRCEISMPLRIRQYLILPVSNIHTLWHDSRMMDSMSPGCTLTLDTPLEAYEKFLSTQLQFHDTCDLERASATTCGGCVNCLRGDSNLTAC